MISDKEKSTVIVEVKKRRGKKVVQFAITKDKDKFGFSASKYMHIKEKETRNNMEYVSENSVRVLGKSQKIVLNNKKIIISRGLSLEELAKKMKLENKKLLPYAKSDKNAILTPNECKEIAENFDYKVKLNLVREKKHFVDKNIVIRSPIVAVVGHVDHGKTSLLDKIRSTNVVEHESGNITQKLSSYQVKFNEHDVTFIDTPGHELFGAMRQNTLSAVDIAVLVIAGDDGLKEQTVEAIKLIQEMGINIVVAFNKIDKVNEEQINRCRYQLLKHNVVVESLGGDVLETCISAKEGTNIDLLMESILLQAELLELRINLNIPAKGMVIESHISRGFGPIAMVILRDGQLKLGDQFIAGSIAGKVKAILYNENKINTAIAGMPVQVIGWEFLPLPGDTFLVDGKLEDQDIFSKDLQLNFNKIDLHTINIILKSDTNGGLAALRTAINRYKIPTNKEIKIVYCSIGNIVDKDIELCRITQAFLITFNVKTSLREENISSITWINSKVIYHILDEFDSLIKDQKIVVGYARIKKVFTLDVGIIAGCIVYEGSIKKGCQANIMRGSKLLHTFVISSLKTETNDIIEAGINEECGILLDKKMIIKEGDILHCLE